MQDINFSKESIKNRMFKRVAALWEIKNIDNLDPVVKLMIEGLAGEIFKLSGEMKNIESRILEKVARALTPANMVSVRPAHAIMRVNAVNGISQIEKTTEFFYKNTGFLKKANLKRLGFTAVCTPQILNGKVAAIVNEKGYYHLDDILTRDIVAWPEQPSHLLSRKMWIGLDLGKEIRSIDNLSFYFDFPYIENKEEYFRLLSYCNWHQGGTPLDVRTGIYSLTNEGDERKERIAHKYELCSMIDDDTLNWYHHRFITIKTRLHHQDDTTEVFPREITGLFPDDVVPQSAKPLLWLKLEFPPFFTEHIIDEVRVNINAFPVANKFKERMEYSINEMSTVVPLIKGENEYFIAVNSVTDSYGNHYSEHISDIDKDKNSFTYSLRRGGCERFNSADAREYLIRLIDLLHDESVAFSGLEKDTLAESAGDLLAQINHLEHKVDLAKKNQEVTSYLILEQEVENARMLFPEYWVSNGPMANDINASEDLFYTSDADIERGTAQLLSATRGGQMAPDANQQTAMYKYHLTSHGSVYSREDIINFCLSRYGNFAEKVEVKRGYTTGIIPGEGIIRTIDVHVFSAEKLGSREKGYFSEELYADLKRFSPDDFNYRVYVQ
ncbi:type VI secretion system baseplate subunit TssF [Marinilabilia salmonicolor]|uniref:type VI secretion system baseplate subunit TssF n=1 Tax=Marinilabilia salmonicolor TaxID=989 RepID=UPI00029AF2B1|nr:type VI secretion system baseplate subunit TssF [Marinilabilia salmonicolor]